MTKEEAKKKAIEKSKVVMETLQLILTDSMQVEGKIGFDSAKNGNEKVYTLEIYVSKRNYERHWFLDIPVIHCNLFYKQILNDLVDNFGNLEKIKVGNFYTIKSDGNKTSYAIKIESSMGSTVTLNFVYKRSKFEELISFFEERRILIENGE